MVSFTIPGKPFGKQRHRSTRRGVMYTPKETISYERLVGTIAMQHFREPLTGPIRLRLLAVFVPAKSWSQKKRAAAMGQPHTQRVDIDNIIKAVGDGLNRIAWADDAQVAEVVARKEWGEVARVEVTVETITSKWDVVV